MDDLAKDTEECNNEKFKIGNVHPNEARSVLPKRNCTKKVVYCEEKHESDDSTEQNDSTVNESE